MRESEIPVDVRDLVKDRLVINVRLKGMRELRWRWRVATFLIKIAAWIVGCGIHVEG